MFIVVLLWVKRLSPVGFVIRLLNTILFPLFVRKCLSVDHNSALLNKLIKVWLLCWCYPVRKQKALSQGIFFCSVYPVCSFHVYQHLPFVFSHSSRLSLPLLTPCQADLLPRGFPVFRGFVQQGGDSGCERHHICCTPKCEHSGTVAPCCVRIINTQGLFCFELLSNQACWLTPIFTTLTGSLLGQQLSRTVSRSASVLELDFPNQDLNLNAFVLWLNIYFLFFYFYLIIDPTKILFVIKIVIIIKIPYQSTIYFLIFLFQCYTRDM